MVLIINLKKIILLLTILVLFSCSDKENEYVNPSLLGKWKLVEIQEDLGNGSVGIYQIVESEVVIEFLENGTYKTNASACSLGYFIGENNTGKFNSTKNILNPEDKCDFDDWGAEIKFDLQNSILIIFNTGCFEGCGLKYEKVN